MATWDNVEKSGSTTAWEYNEVNMTYNQLLDPDSNLPVLYNGIGVSTSITNVPKTP